MRGRAIPNSRLNFSLAATDICFMKGCFGSMILNEFSSLGYMVVDMPISKRDFEKALDLRELKEEIVDKLGEIAARFKLAQEEEVATNGGRIDVV